MKRLFGRSLRVLCPPDRANLPFVKKTSGWLFVALAPCLVGLVGCRTKNEPPPAAKETPPRVDAGAPAPVVAPAAPVASTCPALDPAKLAAYATCGTNVVKTPVPQIEDPSESLAPLYERLAELERGTATRPLRIAFYGDSNLTSDFLTGHLRRALQARYGDAGHGWVSLSRPWASYRHEDVSHAGFWPMFKLYAPTTHLVRDRQYGFANLAAESKRIGAAAWVGTTKSAKSKVGQKVSHFELHYLKQPSGGSFQVLIDKKEVRTIETRAAAFEAGIETFDVEDGAHELRCVIRGDGPVRLFGTSLDRSTGDPARAGVQIDSLGAGALQFQRMTWVANDTRREQLARRDYDAIVLWLGMNVMFVPPNRQWAKEVIAELRTALPKAPILLLSPGDTASSGAKKSAPRIVAVVQQLREVARETGVAFWDFREAMGGDGSIINFTKRGLTGQDRIHFGPEGSQLMGDRLLCALSSSFAEHVAKQPNAGCSHADGGAPADR
ncbi:MAG TPA: GDSL-type esterase/lipase family protein [Labilithrix sp.]|nr:GDSL-type esterase/lipase family protein [Labilithrix sp.]